MTELDKDVAIPEEDKPKTKHRARQPKKGKQPAKGLLEAMKFLKNCQKKAGTIQQQHCCIVGNWAAASDGVLTIGVKIEEDFAACPHTIQFEDALKKVGEDLSITQLSETALSIVSGAFKAVVPCVPFDSLQISAPDEPCATIDNNLINALAVTAPIATEGAPNAAYASVLLQSGSAVATNGKLLVEYWHGLDLPPNTLIPKSAAVAIAKCKKDLVQFGYSGPSATFWFEDGSFIKTQLYGEQYPNYKFLLEKDELNPWAVPEEFFVAVKAIEAFTKNGIVYFKEGKLASNELENEASTYTIEGLPDNMAFNSKYLMLVKDCFEKVHFEKSEDKAYFFGNNSRGVIMGLEMNKDFDPDKDIPF